MKILKISIITLILFFTSSSVNAATTNETMFMDIYNITNDLNVDKSDVAIDYSIEIIKQLPNSLEAFYVTALIPKLIGQKKAMTKFKELKEKFFFDLNNTQTNLPEKILILLLLGIEINNPEQAHESSKIFFDTLTNIKNNCPNKNYVALSTLLLYAISGDKEYYNFYINNFPKHSCVPLANLLYITHVYYTSNDFTTCINQLNKYIKEYDKIYTPFGWEVTLDYYNLLIYCYLRTNNYEAAKANFNLMEIKAPNYDNIKQLRKTLNKH